MRGGCGAQRHYLNRDARGANILTHLAMQSDWDRFDKDGPYSYNLSVVAVPP
jgi:hypothetical protein